MQGHFERAVLLLERARVRAASRGQENMALCCDFLALRLSLCGQAGEPFDFEARRAALLQRHDAVLLHLLESIEAYYYALLGRTDAVPEVFREHRLASVSYFALCRPMMEMIELQVWLAQGQAVKVLARCEELLAACQRFHYGLVALHVRVQMAAAYGLYGQPAEARATLEQALAEAAPDGFWMPLTENYRYLAPLLAQGGWGSTQPGGAGDRSGAAVRGPARPAQRLGRPSGHCRRTDRERAGPCPAGGPAPHQQGDRRNTPPLGGNRQAVHQPAVRQAGHRRGRAKQARPAGCPFWHKILTKG